MLGSNLGRLRGKRPRYPLLHASRVARGELYLKKISDFSSPKCSAAGVLAVNDVH